MTFQTTSAGRRNLIRAHRDAAAVFAPPPKLTVSQWADQNRRLSSIDSSEPGSWQTSRAEYQRGIMDAFNDPDIEEVIVKSSAQVGKTQILNNVLGYFIDQDPCPIMVVQPTENDAKEWSKDRFQRGMVECTPCLRDKVQESKTGKKSESTNYHQVFPGGQLTVAWSNSSSRLASRPIRIVLQDETDKYKVESGLQGDPSARADKRTTTFWNRKLGKFSTPTVRPFSLIDKKYQDSDQRTFHVACPHCKETGPIEFFESDTAQFFMKWDKTQNGAHLPNTAHLICLRCGAVVEERFKDQMISKGFWVANNPGGKIAGFYIWEGYSPWVEWSDIVDKFLKARRDPGALQHFYNESLGVAWELQGESLSDNTLYNRREDYKARVPMGVSVITAAFDTQDDRIEAEVRGWGPAEESWSICRRVFRGDPAKPEIWLELEQFLDTRFDHESGVSLPIACTFGDSAGHHTQMVYAFAKRNAFRHVYACIGRSGVRPLSKATSKLRNGAPLVTVGVDTAKEYIYRRLMIQLPKDASGCPGYIHFPKKKTHVLDEEFDEEYFKQLTAEKLVTEWKANRPTRKWVKTRPRNEALDLFVYALGALDFRRVDLNKASENITVRAAQIKAPPAPVEVVAGSIPPPVQKPAARPQRRIITNSFVNSW